MKKQIIKDLKNNINKVKILKIFTLTILLINDSIDLECKSTKGHTTTGMDFFVLFFI